MKTFIYKLSPRTKAGNVTATIYRVKANEPLAVATTTWNTAAYAGARVEVQTVLVAGGHIQAHKSHQIFEV